MSYSQNSTRRSLLAGVGGVIVSLPGNSRGSSQSQSEEYPPVFEGAAELQRHLREQTSFSASVRAEPDDALFVGFTSERRGDELAEQIAVIAKEYASYNTTYPFGRLEGRLSANNGALVANWFIEPEWAQAYAEGDLSEGAYLERIRTTYVSADDFAPSQLEALSDTQELVEYLNEEGFDCSARVQPSLSVNLFYTSFDTATALSESATLEAEIGVIIYVYGFLISQGSPIGQLNAMVKGQEMVHIGRWKTDRRWAIDFNSAALTESEYEARVKETAEDYLVECHPAQC